MPYRNPEFTKRLKAALYEKGVLDEKGEFCNGFTGPKLAKVLKFKQSTVYKYLDNKNAGIVPQIEELLKITDFIGKTVDWLLTGEDAQPKRMSGCYDLIPKYKARLSGGDGSLETSDQIESNLAFRKDWLKDKGVDKKYLALFEVVGDSMAPCIHSGAVVMVDRTMNTLKDIIEGKIYAFRQDDTVKVKRLWVKGTIVEYKSDNTLEGDQGHFDCENDNVDIIGRVIWVGHEVR